MKLIVVDASALAEYLLGTTRAGAIAETITSTDVDLNIPYLCDVEVAAVLRRGALSGRLTRARVAEALVDYLDLPVIRHPHERLLARVLELRLNFSAYDAIYAALAEHLHSELLTADRALARAVRRHLSVPITVT